jgi:hypothetical protein
MAKKDIVQDVVEAVETQPVVTKNPIIITMQDGQIKNFGERGKLLSTQEVSEAGFAITFHVVTGEQSTYTFDGDMALLIEMAAFGAASKIKAATAGLENEKIKAIIDDKIAEFNLGDFNTRAGGDSVVNLSQIQTAYAIVNSIDINTQEGINKVQAIFAALSKKEKSDLYKNVDIKLELATIQYEAAKLAKEKSTN